ncbi:hypothetical protein AN958_03289 [Leucoagaricus sp. SymC.cos]|nr:hypothetical protein AN958_03289 [Leucoagaricus sp. SymC.cos]
MITHRTGDYGQIPGGAWNCAPCSESGRRRRYTHVVNTYSWTVGKPMSRKKNVVVVDNTRAEGSS